MSGADEAGAQVAALLEGRLSRLVERLGAQERFEVAGVLDAVDLELQQQRLGLGGSSFELGEATGLHTAGNRLRELARRIEGEGE